MEIKKIKHVKEFLASTQTEYCFEYVGEDIVRDFGCKKITVLSTGDWIYTGEEDLSTGYRLICIKQNMEKVNMYYFGVLDESGNNKMEDKSLSFIKKVEKCFQLKHIAV